MDGVYPCKRIACLALLRATQREPLHWHLSQCLVRRLGGRAVVLQVSLAQAGMHEEAGRGVRRTAHQRALPTKPHASVGFRCLLAFWKPEFYQLPGQIWPITTLAMLRNTCLLEEQV